MNNYSVDVIQSTVDDQEHDWLYYEKHNETGWNILVPHWEQSQRDYFKYVKDFKVIVTAGAHIGYFVRFYAKKFERVYAFEPVPFHFHCMVNNNQVDNVIKMQCALGNENKLIGMHDPFNKNLTFQVDQQKQIYPMLTLDSFNLDACDLLQLDIEGYEIEAVEGAVNTINKYKPVIIVEKQIGDEKINKLNNALTGLGYTLKETLQHDLMWTFE